jgi:hypothetical protein
MYLIDVMKSGLYECHYADGCQIIVKDNWKFTIKSENVEWKHELWPPKEERENPMNRFIFGSYDYEIKDDDTEVFWDEDVIIKVPRYCKLNNQSLWKGL